MTIAFNEIALFIGIFAATWAAARRPDGIGILRRGRGAVLAVTIASSAIGAAGVVVSIVLVAAGAGAAALVLIAALSALGPVGRWTRGEVASATARRFEIETARLRVRSISPEIVCDRLRRVTRARLSWPVGRRYEATARLDGVLSRPGTDGQRLHDLVGLAWSWGLEGELRRLYRHTEIRL